MRADIHEDAAHPVEDEVLERMTALVDFRPVRKRDPAAGEALDDCFDRALRVRRERIEPKNRLMG
jgi:hypothetical protein